jgi:hypothetical protein
VSVDSKYPHVVDGEVPVDREHLERRLEFASESISQRLTALQAELSIAGVSIGNIRRRKPLLRVALGLGLGLAVGLLAGRLGRRRQSVDALAERMAGSVKRRVEAGESLESALSDTLGFLRGSAGTRLGRTADGFVRGVLATLARSFVSAIVEEMTEGKRGRSERE